VKRVIGLFAISVAIAGCDPLATRPPTSINAADSAAVTPLLIDALYLSETATQVNAVAGLATLDPSQLFWTNAAQCRPDATNLLYECPFVSSLGPASVTSYALYEGSNRFLGYNAAATTSIQVTWFGSLTLGNPSSLVHQTENSDISIEIAGLQTGAKQFSGIAYSSFIDSPSSAGTSVFTTITDVALGPQHYPVAGSMRSSITVADSTHATVSRTMTLAFDGSSTGTVLITNGVSTQSCTIDLTSPAKPATCPP
jgi:hypothetical protein